MGQGVGGYMCYRRIGRKLQHHDDVLLHLVLEHERTLWKETLLSRKEKKTECGEGWRDVMMGEVGEGAGRQRMEK